MKTYSQEIRVRLMVAAEDAAEANDRLAGALAWVRLSDKLRWEGIGFQGASLHLTGWTAFTEDDARPAEGPEPEDAA